MLCTECYIQKDNKTLMLYRNKKEKDINKNKWIGLGGKFELGESPEECLLREINEEAGVTLTSYRWRGLVTFMMTDGSEPIYMFIYTADAYEGTVSPCAEGELQWIDDDQIDELNLWEGDRLFWEWLRKEERFFSAKFVYEGDKLLEHSVAFHGAELDL